MSYRLPLFALAVALIAASILRAESPTGIVPDRPREGRSVDTGQGFMVPYKVRIPGSEASFEMIPVPGGEFVLGSPSAEPGRKADEGPQIRVKVEPYWIGKYEVTWAEYKEFMNLYGFFKEFEIKKKRQVTEENKLDAITAPTELYDPSFTFELGEHPRQPASTMTQYAAKQYTKWLSAITGHQYRLPMESEWEYACRAGSSSAYSFGDQAKQLGDYAWFYDNASETTHLVGQKKPNAWGIYDMHGNVAEWVLDQYDAEHYAKLSKQGDGPLPVAKTMAWPTKLFPRVVRGGSWDHDPAGCRAASRMTSHDDDWRGEDPNIPLSPWWFTNDPARGVGFRIIRPLKRIPREEMERYWRADVKVVQQDVKDRLDEGRGALGLVDKNLPEAIQKLNDN